MSLKRPKWAQDLIAQSNHNKKPEQITIVPGLIGGAKDITYTGAGADGKIQTDAPTMMDATSYHEGEVVVPKKDVDGMGGPNAAMMKIKQLQMKKAEGRAPSISGYKCGGKVRRYEDGGIVGNQEDEVGSQAWAAKQAASTVGNQEDEVGSQAWAAKQAAPTIEPDVTNNAFNAVQAPTITPEPVKDESNSLEFTTNNSNTQGTGTTYDATTDKTTQVPMPVTPTPAVTPPVAQPPAVKPTAQYDKTVSDMLSKLKGIADGTSDVFKRQASAAFQQLDARAQTNLLSTAMKIANNPNISEGAKRTMMAEEMRSAGIQQSQLAGTLANSAMDMAMSAIGQTANLAQAERSNVQTENINKLNALKDAGDIEGYAKAARDVFGVDIDISNIKSADTLNKISSGNNALGEIITQFGDSTTMAVPGTKLALQAIHDAMFPGQTMTDEWANDYLAQVKNSYSSSWQFMNGISEDDANLWFQGDDSQLANFEFGKNPDGTPKYKGLEAFRRAMYSFSQGGAFKINEDGSMDFNEENPLYQSLIDTLGYKKATSPNSTDTTARKVGDSYTAANGKTYTVAAIDASGNITSLTDSTGRATTLSDIRKNVSIPESGMYVNEQANGTVYFDGEQVTSPLGRSVRATEDSDTGYVDSKGIPVDIGDDGFATYPMAAIVDGKLYTNGTLDSTVGSVVKGQNGNLIVNKDGTVGFMAFGDTDVTAVDEDNYYDAIAKLTPEQKSIVVRNVATTSGNVDAINDFISGSSDDLVAAKELISKNSSAVASYLASDPNKIVDTTVSALISSGSTPALDFVTGKIAEGDAKYFGLAANPKVAAYIAKNSTNTSKSPAGIREFSISGPSEVPKIGSFISNTYDGKTSKYLVSSHKPRTKQGGRYVYHVMLTPLDGSAAFEVNYYGDEY